MGGINQIGQNPAIPNHEIIGNNNNNNNNNNNGNNELQENWNDRREDEKVKKIDQFAEFIASNANKLSEELPENQNTSLNKNVLMETFNALYHNFISDSNNNFKTLESNENFTEEELDQAFKDAKTEAENALNIVKKEWAKAVLDEITEKEKNINPNRINVTSDDQGMLNVIRKAKEIKTLVFSGGGAKGVVYPAALHALEDNGKLNHIETFKGTSVGGLTATYLAFDMTINEFEELSNKNSITVLKEPVDNFDSKYTDISFNNEQKEGSSETNGEKAIEVMDQNLSAITQNYLVDNWDTVSTSEALNKDEKSRLEDLKNQTGEEEPRDPLMITFNDLSILRKLDPGKFKNLELTGFNLDTQEGMLFNSENTPDMPIAYAARITMSLPGLFSSVNIGTPESTFIDGGFYTNIPETENDANSETMILAFDNNGVFTSIQHDPRVKYEDPSRTNENNGYDSYGKTIGIDVPLLSKIYFDDEVKLYEAGPRAMNMRHPGIETDSENLTPEVINFAKTAATAEVLTHLALTEYQGQSESYDNLNDVFDSLTEEEKNALVEDEGDLNAYEEELRDMVLQERNQ